MNVNNAIFDMAYSEQNKDHISIVNGRGQFKLFDIKQPQKELINI